jgi:hypothetical protein
MPLVGAQVCCLRFTSGIGRRYPGGLLGQSTPRRGREVPVDMTFAMTLAD